jgi:hypothetical protein
MDEPRFVVKHCRSCHAEIIWAETGRGVSMPVDAEVSAFGTVTLDLRPSPAKPLARVVPGKLAFGRRDLRRPHHSTCPYAAEHRRRKR